MDSLWSLRDANRAAAYVSRDVAMDLHGQRVSSRLRIVCGREERSDIPRGYSRARPLQFVTNRITRTTAGQGRVSAVCVKSNATEHSLSPGVKIRQQHVAGRKRRYVRRAALRPPPSVHTFLKRHTYSAHRLAFVPLSRVSSGGSSSSSSSSSWALRRVGKAGSVEGRSEDCAGAEGPPRPRPPRWESLPKRSERPWPSPPLKRSERS